MESSLDSIEAGIQEWIKEVWPILSTIVKELHPMREENKRENPDKRWTRWLRLGDICGHPLVIKLGQARESNT